MLLQEVGFDIFSIWGQMGWIARGVIVVFALEAAFLMVVAVSKLLRRA